MTHEHSPHAAGLHPGLEDLFRYPLMASLVERRTRRVARGVSLNAGEQSHQSTNRPEPLTPLEEAVLVVVATGITGITMHDGPLVKPSGLPELGTPFLNILARTGSSADNAQATRFFLINDDGIFLLRFPEGRAGLEALRDLPPKWSDWREEHWLAAAERAKVRISDKRLDFPRVWPYYLGWNAQHSNVPGSSVFFPVVDCTWQYINALLIIASEPAPKRMMFIDDWRKFQPKGLVEWMAKIGGALGLSPEIPYHPIGGLKHVRSGYVSKDVPGPLGMGNTLRTDYEAFFYLQNLMLVGQGLGLGGWVHGAVFAPYIFQRDAEKGFHGLGFRFQEPKKLSPMPPVPASQPTPVGIDGILEALCPPYVKSMDEAVDRVVERKYSAAGGSYGDKDVFGRSYAKGGQGDAYLKLATRFTPECIAYVKEICNYVYDTYGRFPAHVDSWYTPGIWLQFSHLELEYYQKFFDPGLFARQSAHDGVWHPERGGGT